MLVSQKKLKIELPYNSITLLLDIYPKEGGGGTTNSKRYLQPVFIAALFITAKIWKQGFPWWSNVKTLSFR